MAAGVQQGVRACRFYFPRLNTLQEDQKRGLLALAYQTAKASGISAPKKIFIRSGLHPTTIKYGIHIQDPDGDHVTVSFKDEAMVRNHTHVTAHGYNEEATPFALRKAIASAAKADSTPRTIRKPKKDGTVGKLKEKKPIWPADEEKDLEEYSLSPADLARLAQFD